MKTAHTAQIIQDFIPVMKGCPKSRNFSKTIKFLIQNLSLHSIPSDLIDPYLELLTVLFLKSEDVMKMVLLKDIFGGIFIPILENITTIVEEGNFKWKLLMPRMRQYSFCISSGEHCQYQELIDRCSNDS